MNEFKANKIILQIANFFGAISLGLIILSLFWMPLAILFGVDWWSIFLPLRLALLSVVLALSCTIAFTLILEFSKL